MTAPAARIRTVAHIARYSAARWDQAVAAILKASK
jgi:hypothetical protein